MKMLRFMAALGLLFMASPLQAAAVAGFSGGAGTSAPDQFEGTAGEGWSREWFTQDGSGGTTTFRVLTPSDPDHAPLNGGGAYLRIDYVRTDPMGNARAGIAREVDLAGPEGMDLTRPYEIRFDFRLDELTGFSESTDQILFSTEDGITIRDSKEAAPWYLWIRGDEGFSVQNGSGDGKAGRVKLSRLGLTVRTGVVYSVVVTLDPQTATYDLTISDGMTTFRASDANEGKPLGFRTKDLADRAHVFQARMTHNEPDDHFAISLDQIAITPGDTSPENSPAR